MKIDRRDFLRLAGMDAVVFSSGPGKLGNLANAASGDCPGLGIRIDIRPGKVNRLRFVPDKVGAFPFHCDNFCGSGHEGMRGMVTVVE